MAEPDLLYHYQPGRIDWLCRMFVESEVMLSDPRTFNDPWDCRPVFRREAEYSPAERRRLIEGQWTLARVVWPDRDEHEARLKTQAEDTEFPRWLGGIEREYARRITEDWAIFCLSDGADVDLMWSHYADRHRGLCLGFARNTAIVRDARPVAYACELKKLRIDAPDDEAARDAFLTKSEVWQHEREWRALVRRSSSAPHRPDTPCASTEGFCRIDLEGLVSITFGLYFSAWERQAVQEIARAHSWQGTFQEAVKANDEYKVVIRELPA